MPNIRKYKDKATAKKAQMRCINERNKRVYKGYTIRFSLEEDKDIIEFVNSQPEKTIFFRKVVREYMEKHK